jgi:ribonuclease-3
MTKLSEEEKQKLNKLSTKLDVSFKSLSHLKDALIHRSYINEAGKGFQNNERLEFLGDAVLELVVTEYLFEKYQNFPEGELTSLRAALVKTESLAEESMRLGVGEYLYMSKGEELSGGRQRPYILANTMESLIGAIYLEKGCETAKKFILKNICYKIDLIVEKKLNIDPKSRLQEISQEQLRITPIYKELSATGPDHNKNFEMAVIIGDFVFGKGVGKSKQQAEQTAAIDALSNWEKLAHTYFE